MPFDETNIGNPFAGEFPEWPTERRVRLEADIQRQVIELAQRRYEPALRHEMARALQQRRQDYKRRKPRGRDPIVVDFDFLPVKRGFDTLMARGELLITKESYEGGPRGRGRTDPSRCAKGYLDTLGIGKKNEKVDCPDCPELNGRVVQLNGAGLGPGDLANVAELLRMRGFTASVTNIAPTAPVGKAIGGADPVPGLGKFKPYDGPGTPTKVAIIDTGIAEEKRRDRWLNDIDRDGNIDPLYEFSPDGKRYLDLDAGHGTFIAGIIKQVAPGAKIKVYRALDSDGVGTEVGVACAMIRAVKEDAEILNLSLGCQTLDDQPPIAIKAALEVISELEHRYGREVLVVAAAGNFGDTRPCWPAAFREVVSVAGLAPDMLPSQWSTHGFWVTCSTIGQGLRSTYVEGRQSIEFDPTPHTFGPDAWAAWNGTSFAAPQITGALARLHQEKKLPLREALQKVLAVGRPIPDFGQALKILPGI
ncbi:MAG: S8 family peptidase [Micromonosporaceae bacterium]